MRKNMMVTAAMLAYFGAAGIAMMSALFGVGMARVLWADDLKHAQHIDEIRSKTEVHLKNTIASLERQLELKK